MSELDPPPVSRWAQVAPAETPSLRSLTTLAGSVVIVAALYFGREVLIPITLAILLSSSLLPSPACCAALSVESRRSSYRC